MYLFTALVLVLCGTACAYVFGSRSTYSHDGRDWQKGGAK